MTYKMKCPMCEYEIVVMAVDENDGVVKMKEEAKKHVGEIHKDAPMMAESDMEKMIKESWRMEM